MNFEGLCMYVALVTGEPLNHTVGVTIAININIYNNIIYKPKARRVTSKKASV